MRPRVQPTALWRAVPMLALFMWAMAATVALAADGPKMTVTELNHPPYSISYFEDSDVILYHNPHDKTIHRSSDAGFSWKPVDAIPEEKVVVLSLHEFEPKTAFALTEDNKHYKTEDQGETWTEFKTEHSPSAFQSQILVFHAGDPQRIIFNGMDCDGIFCDEVASYTTDSFKSSDVLRAFTSGCWWAKSSLEFTSGDENKDKTRTMCIVRDPFSLFKEDQGLHISDSFFAVEDGKIQEFEPDMDTNHGVTGVTNLAVVKSFILVATASFESDEMALYVTTDTLKWHRAMFPTDDSHDHSHRINQEAYTVLESTKYSIQIDVMTSRPSSPMGVLFTSNSNGTYFTENIPYTNRDERGHVDFEKISGIQGIFLVNTVENGHDVDKSGDDKKVITRITFDDGRVFEPIKVGEDNVHLHSVTELDNIGRVYSSPAPGLIMANGNTGKSLGTFGDANLYVSDNAGLTWSEALKGPHKYEFGDSGSILMAIKDSRKADIDSFSYSLNHGADWTTVSLPGDLKIHVEFLTTTQDSTSTKFLLLGRKEENFYTVAIDFDNLLSRTCEDKDMEDWHARVDDDGNPTCIMGHKQSYRRRKKSADCFVRSKFKDPVLKTEDCECTDADFECDYNFQRDPDDSTVCKPVGPIVDHEDSCKGKKDGTFMGSSGWRLIPGDTCKRKSGAQKDDPMERNCDSTGSTRPPLTGEVSHVPYTFETEYEEMQKVYLEKGESNDETIIVRPIQDAGGGIMHVGDLYLSSDHGKKWHQILKDEDIENIHSHQYFKEVVFFTTSGKKVIYSVDRGNTFHSFQAPTKAFDGYGLNFHPDKKDWLIWIGRVCDVIDNNESCFSEAFISTDRGDHWKTMQRFVEKCEFTGHTAYNFRSLKQIVCLGNEEETNDSPLAIFSSNDFFDQDKTVFKGAEIENFATMSEFIVVAGVEDGKRRALASLDGKHFEEAHFPYNFRPSNDNQYTLLDSSTHAINLFVRTQGAAGQEYGSIVKSNSNGTSYVLSATNVNCNAETYVDYERAAGIEGLALINVVTNPDKKPKKLHTKISHNDGSQWGYLPPPSKDINGKSYTCSSSRGDSSCALHLHHYTERDDKRKTFAASTAVGLMFGVGNVGSELGDIKDADTYMTMDAGITWKNVKKGHWTWQYGDQGSIIVLVQRATSKNDVKTKMVSYSTDEGKTWVDYEFNDKEVTVLDITTLRSGTSRNFLLWCRDGKKVFSVNLDFTGLADQPCTYSDAPHSDYYIWSPSHPTQTDDCLFGHVAQYLRKKTDRRCYNERGLQHLFGYSPCECKREDFECDYNYQMDNTGQCSLVPGFQPLSGQEYCTQNPNATSWFEPTGYRRVPLSTCEGGREMDRTSTEHPCAGFEDEFERKHRASGLAIFFAVIVPFGIAAAIGYYVYRNWNGKFGQIRLGEQSATFDSDQPWVKYPVIAVSAVAATVATLPLVLTSVWRWASGTYQRVRGESDQTWLSGGTRRFTTRDSFARGRSDYSMVDDDEGELLGDDSDDEPAPA